MPSPMRRRRCLAAAGSGSRIVLLDQEQRQESAPKSGAGSTRQAQRQPARSGAKEKATGTGRSAPAKRALDGTAKKAEGGEGAASSTPAATQARGCQPQRHRGTFALAHCAEHRRARRGPGRPSSSSPPGKGTRMRRAPDLAAGHKVLHPIAGRPMLSICSTPSTRSAPSGGGRGRQGREQVEARLPARRRRPFAVQAEQKGTAHAVQQAEGALAGFDGDVLILYGDTPCVEAETLRACSSGWTARTTRRRGARLRPDDPARLRPDPRRGRRHRQDGRI
jgi:hypothetical protein